MEIQIFLSRNKCQWNKFSWLHMQTQRNESLPKNPIQRLQCALTSFNRLPLPQSNFPASICVILRFWLPLLSLYCHCVLCFCCCFTHCHFGRRSALLTPWRHRLRSGQVRWLFAKSAEQMPGEVSSSSRQITVNAITSEWKNIFIKQNFSWQISESLVPVYACYLCCYIAFVVLYFDCLFLTFILQYLCMKSISLFSCKMYFMRYFIYDFNIYKRKQCRTHNFSLIPPFSACSKCFVLIDLNHEYVYLFLKTLRR